MIDPLIGRAIATAFALLLLLAAWHKVVGARRASSRPWANTGCCPRRWSRPVARLLPIVEAVLGLAWLTGFAPGTVALADRRPCSALYAVAIAINLWRGRVHIGCGCGFGAASGEDPPLSWWLVARNLLLGAVAMARGVAAGRAASSGCSTG